MSSPAEGVQDLQSTTCCVVGGGPGGVMLAFLLARQGVPVVLLEAQKDFDRAFRGDSINPAVMEIMEELGLADRLQQIRHLKVHSVTLRTVEGPVKVTDFTHLRSRYPYITVIQQSRFLDFIVEEARRYPNFHVIMRAQAQELIEEKGVVRGVRYRGEDGWHEVRAALTVGADGRGSHLRKLAGFEPRIMPSPFDVLWFPLPRYAEDSETPNLSAYFGRGYYFALTDRFDYWQVAYVIPKGSYPSFRSAGLDALRRSIADIAPEFADRVDTLQDWSDVRLLSVQMLSLSRWYRPGLLLIGDAAHVMSSVGGVGITCAILDAVVAANVLARPMKDGVLCEKHLAGVQDRRKWPIRIMQALQRLAEQQFAAKALDPRQPFRVPLSLRLPFMHRLTGWVIGSGLWPVHIES